MRISDWSSDVCSSDLRARLLQVGQAEIEAQELPFVWTALPYSIPAAQAEPAHFYRISMEPAQFAEEVQRLQGLWLSSETHLEIGRASGRERVCPDVYI